MNIQGCYNGNFRSQWVRGGRWVRGFGSDCGVCPTQQAPFFFIHIPKCAGGSFMHDAKRIVSPTPFLNNSERCLADRQSRHDQILAIMLRSPLTHVLSQFLRCKYAPIHLDRTAFPSGPGLYGGFEEWITHFLQLRDRQQTMATSTSITEKAKQAFSCYNPWNMQTRYLTSKKKDRVSECFRELCPCHLAFVSEFNPDITHSFWTLWVSLRAYAFCISAAIALCPSPVLVVG